MEDTEVKRNVVGPGAIKVEETAPKPTLDGFSEYQYVEILNPLSDDFMVQVAQDVPVNVPFEVRAKTALHQTETDITRTLGFGLKNDDHQARKQIFNNTIIPSGKSKVFKGNEAQVVIRQLVNEILQRRGNKSKLLMSNPTLRAEVEAEIIVRYGNVQELLDTNFQTERSQVDQALTKANEVGNEFPGLENPGKATEGTDTVPGNDTAKSDKKDGSAKKAS